MASSNDTAISNAQILFEAYEVEQRWTLKSNLSFEISDCCDTRPYQENSFDFIHVRGLYGCVANWGWSGSDGLWCGHALKRSRIYCRTRFRDDQHDGQLDR